MTSSHCQYIENGTRGPGKFEGEECRTLFASYWIANGEGDWCDDNQTEDDNCKVLVPPFAQDDVDKYNTDNPEEHICSPCAAYILTITKPIHCWESSEGFVYSDEE